MIDEQSLSEEQWLACKGPFPMINFLEGKTNSAINSALVHFAFACCRRLERWIPPKRRTCLTVIKRWTENKATTEKVRSVVLNNLQGWEPPLERNLVVREMIADALYAFVEYNDNPVELARKVCGAAQQASWYRRNKQDNEEAEAQAKLMRAMVSYSNHKLA